MDEMKIENGAFVVDNDEKANWAIRKVRDVKLEEKRQIENLEREILRYQMELERVKKSADNDCKYFEGLLAAYADKLKEAGKLKFLKSGNAKYTLPDGKIKYVAASEKWQHDDDKLLESLKAAQLGQLVRVKEVPAWNEIKARLCGNEDGTAYIEAVNSETGEITRIKLDGVKSVIEPAKYVVEITED